MSAEDIVERIRDNLPSIEWEMPLAAERERLAVEEIERLRHAIEGAEALIVRFMCDDGPLDWQETCRASDLNDWVQAIPANERDALLRAMPDLLAPPASFPQETPL